MKANSNIIKMWLSNRSYKSRDLGHFILVYDLNKEKLYDLLKDIKISFPNNNSYINDLSSDMFIYITV